MFCLMSFYSTRDKFAHETDTKSQKHDAKKTSLMDTVGDKDRKRKSQVLPLLSHTVP